MAKKNTIITVALVGVAAYLIITAMKKKPRVTVTADSPIKQNAEEYEAEYEVASSQIQKPNVIEKATSILSTIFPKKTKAQKTAGKTVKAQKKAVTLLKSKSAKTKKKGAALLSKNIIMPTFAGFSDSQCLY